MPQVELADVTLAYNTFGPDTADSVVLIAGLSQPAGAWELGAVPALVGAGFHVVTFDNRGVEPSTSPPAPYSIDDMVTDTLGLIDHLGLEEVSVVGYSMGGWIAETLAFAHPDRIKAAVFIGSCNEGTAWEKAVTTVERDLAKIDPPLPPLYAAVDTMRYLTNAELQSDEVVSGWLELISDLPAWQNPGKLGQYEAALGWSLDVERFERWPQIKVPCLVLSFENDIDSPPRRAQQAAERIPGAEFVELAGASHLGVFTHAAQVGETLAGFLKKAVSR
jgi:pimeloyl-ACP methyl ester carboxylesterase